MNVEDDTVESLLKRLHAKGKKVKVVDSEESEEELKVPDRAPESRGATPTRQMNETKLQDMIKALENQVMTGG